MFLHWSCIYIIMKHKKICKCKTSVEFRNITANVSTQMRPSRLIGDCWWNGTNLPDESVGKSWAHKWLELGWPLKFWETREGTETILIHCFYHFREREDREEGRRGCLYVPRPATDRISEGSPSERPRHGLNRLHLHTMAHLVHIILLQVVPRWPMRPVCWGFNVLLGLKGPLSSLYILYTIYLTEPAWCNN